MNFAVSSHSKMGRTMRNAIQWLCLSAALFLLCSPAFSQLNYGRIFGAVTDQSGASLMGATVTILDVDRGVSRPLSTDAAGEYSAPSLIPGTYAVRAEFKGFKTIERTDIVVGVGQDIRVDLSLQPGDQTQTVTVTGEAPQINTTNAQLGGTIENQAVADLPCKRTHLHWTAQLQAGACGQAGRHGECLHVQRWPPTRHRVDA